jgi:serine/threonine protein kinase
MQKLGEGGFGSVFQAMRGAEPVAVKFLNRADEEALSFFAREARNLYRLISNPHVVRLIEYNDANTPPFIAMEYCVGGSLISWVMNVRPWPEVVAAMLHACAGLSEIHRLGGFHRDIKPENMLLSTDGNAWIVKLGDLGLARIPTDDSSMTQRAAGTRAYMAPELFAKQPYTSASDIYSLGITTCELLTGSRDLDSLSALAIPEPLRKLIQRFFHRSIDRSHSRSGVI